MRSVSDKFLEALSLGHGLTTRATLLPEGTDLPISSGAVTVDSKAATRYRAEEIVIHDDGSLGFVPDSSSSGLAPYGNEISLERGIRYADGTEELIGIGVFRIEDADVDDSGSELSIRLTTFDRSMKVSEAKFEEPYQVASGTNFVTAITDALEVAGDFDTNLTATTLETPVVIVAQTGDDRWEFCLGLAKAIGMELFFDGDGTLVLRPISNGTSVLTISEGDGGLLLGASRRWTRQDSNNRVIATGENVGELTVARGVATDDNPLSPTHYYGTYGKVPLLYASEYISTDDQAQDVAEALLAKKVGTTQSVDFSMIVNPALEAGDVVTINRERVGITSEDHVLDSLTIPLGSTESASAQTRAIQVTS